MKICINSILVASSYGGGMQFATFLRHYLEDRGVTVVNTLSDEDIDVILHVNPFPLFAKASSFSYLAAARYRYRHPKTRIIHRVNECDERKGTLYVNKMLARATAYADHVVFISQWLADVLGTQDVGSGRSFSIIRNGADEEIFYPQRAPVMHKRKLTLVTHHWSGHSMKGHDVYATIDELLGSDAWVKDYFSFVYIGNVPTGTTYNHIDVRPPVAGEALAKQLRSCDVYITGSQHEPAGMHHIEGALCGLPLLYRTSGALPEYCEGFGVGFSGPEDIEQALRDMYDQYHQFRQKMSEYPWTATRMAAAYDTLFREIVQKDIKQATPATGVILWVRLLKDWSNDIVAKCKTYV